MNSDCKHSTSTMDETPTMDSNIRIRDTSSGSAMMAEPEVRLNSGADGIILRRQIHPTVPGDRLPRATGKFQYQQTFPVKSDVKKCYFNCRS